MDDLLALFDEEEQNLQQQEELPQREEQIERAPTENHNNASASTNCRQQEEPRPKQPQPQPQQQQKRSRDQQLSASVDNKVGIRMINRKISSTELLDMISESEYQSPASLSAMSLESLNRILVSPAAVLDPATVCGRTRILTVGLVFSNSGTRLSQAGNGFCALTVGNLASGPAITVLLFGSAYNRFVKIAKPGKVIALMNPRLVPPKQQQQQQQQPAAAAAAAGSRKTTSTAARHDTSQTFSVNDEQQVRLVADARDFAFCKATIAARNENGKWVPNSKRCTKHVDLRIGEYCHTHRKQALVKDGGNKGSGKGGLGQLRMEARAFTTATKLLPQRGMTTLFPSSQSQSTALDRSQARSREISQLSLSSRTTLGTSLRTFSATTRQAPTKNAILNPYKNARPEATILKRPPATVTPHDMTIATKPDTNKDWLQEATSKKATTTTKPHRRTINTDSTQFDGSVAIPRPWQMFAGGPRLAIPQQILAARKNATKNNNKSAQDVLLQQKQVAAQLKHQKALARLKRTHPPFTKNTAKSSDTTSREDLLFGSLGDIDRDKILNAKSRFSQEVDAQEYARARQSVTELEFEEARKDASNKKKMNDTGRGAIQKEWHCVNCGRSYSTKPNRCYTLNHTVKVRRSIEHSKSITEKRQELSDRDAKDGGLTLGQGLDWSRWNKFS